METKLAELESVKDEYLEKYIKLNQELSSVIKIYDQKIKELESSEED
jgi:hypothetical protein